MRHEWAPVSRRIDVWDFLTWLLFAVGTVVLWLVLSVLFGMSRDETLISGAVMGALVLLMLAAMIGCR